ncbi:MAG: nitrite reductase (NAD(P)H) small subunit [Ignavibacteriales bacterium]|nr:nitrite reductase (NAD(P)H) small subunit [Ignavibacteriales bacterium]
MSEELNGFEYLCEFNDLKDSYGQRFYINDVDVAAFKVGEKIFAVSNICPHQHSPQIYEGFVENECVVCPLHGWTFRLDNGNLFGGSKGLDVYETKIINGKVYVKVFKKELNW